MLINKKILINSLIIIVILSAGSYWFFGKKNQNNSMPFKTQKPTTTDMVQIVNATGTLRAKDQITVGSLLAGKVDKILVDDNDFVKKDQVLAVLDNGIGDTSVKKLRAVLLEVKANLKYQKKFHERQKQLFEAGQLSKDTFQRYVKDLQILEAKVLQTNAELEAKTKEYENLFIKSPDNGIVIAKEIDQGQMVTSQLQATKLYVIAKDLKEMETHVDVDEADIGQVKEGQEATFTVDAFPKLKFMAKVKQIRYLAKIVDNVVTYATILDVNNPELKLRPGMTTNVDITVAEAKGALVVHNKTLRISEELLKSVADKLGYQIEKHPESTEKSEIDHVWVLEDSNKFRQIKVELGVREGAFTQIAGDINKDSDIVYEVTEINRDNVFLKQLLSKPGGIGKK